MSRRRDIEETWFAIAIIEFFVICIMAVLLMDRIGWLG